MNWCRYRWKLRKQRDAASKRAQHAAEVRAATERRANAKTEQLKQAFLMAKADARVRQLEAFLDPLEPGVDGLAPPYPDRAGVGFGPSKGNLPPSIQLMKC
ncbi:hypothetical protein [Variovorax paradoxus]|uniref:hypothetical protein n=1 Tax=Variovorax paradoxus TaxID=34073 RepID=UPI00247FB847|nr:hypothetical protein [Variovorax paradoxus]WGT62425.1 hypothetical protein QHG62_20525 [Variovorax paradoxus]